MKTRTFISYQQDPDATPEAEFSALVGVYRLALDAHSKKKEAARPCQVNDPDDGTESKGDSADAPKYIR